MKCHCNWCKRLIAEGENYWHYEMKDPHIFVALCEQCYEMWSEKWGDLQ